jgi:thymidylate synthase (FAD)
MKLVKPYVKYKHFKDNESQIAYAARVCYAAEPTDTDDQTFILNLWNKRNHRSPFRHGTVYLEISSSFERILSNFIKSPFCTCVFIKEEYSWYISTNLQFIRELDENISKTIQNFFVGYDYIRGLAFNRYPQLKDIIRLSFEIVTQVSTSRELNRVSPNNICEQSTRFCNFSNEKKFGNDIAFCEPHWLDATTFYDTVNNKEIEREEEVFRKREDGKIVAFCNGKCLNILNKYPIATKGIDLPDGSNLLYSPHIAIRYIEGLIDDEERYFEFLKLGMRPEDARGILGLDVATKCFYTYSVKEWKHIIDLRYKGVTGRPHPNAKIVAEEIYNNIKFMDLLYNYE